MPGKLYSVAVVGWVMFMGSAFAAGKAAPKAPPDYLDGYLGVYEVKKNSKNSPRKYGHFFREDVVHAESGRKFSLYQLSLHNLEPESPHYKDTIDLLLIRDDAGKFFHTLYANGLIYKTVDGKFYRLPQDFARLPTEELGRALIPYTLRRGRIRIREPELSSIVVKFTRHDRMEVRLREFSASAYLIPSIHTDRYTLGRIPGADEEGWIDALSAEAEGVAPYEGPIPPKSFYGPDTRVPTESVSAAGSRD